VNKQLRKSNSYFKTLPLVECGDGRTYASAARSPRPFETGVKETAGAAFIAGTLRLLSKFDVSGPRIDVERLSENDGDSRFKEMVEAFVEAED
jgi:hypothetical protein